MSHQTAGQGADLIRRYDDIRTRLFNGTTPPERPRRFIPVRPQSHRPDFVIPTVAKPKLPMVRMTEEAKQRVRDILLISQECRAEPFDPGHWLDIIDQVCAKHGLSRAELLSARRSKPFVIARHEAMYRMSKETTLSIPNIGLRMGNKDQSSVRHGINQHIERMKAAKA